MIRDFLSQMPLIAILRGITPEEVLPVGRALVSAGFRVIEVPLNSPRSLDSVRTLCAELGEECLVGAGTVTSPSEVDEIAAAGGRLVVMPHSDSAIVKVAKGAGLCCAPGVATPTEGFAALANGADALKLFPAEQLGPPVLKAWRAVFPADTVFIPVGGITPGSLADFASAGAAGFGLGSALYKPGMPANEVRKRANASVDACRPVKLQKRHDELASMKGLPMSECTGGSLKTRI
jgi:2-dehydro-3-deoxyphosphogalactonate aldolase